ncbi:putative signal transducing protein [Candidatus Darwinibacter acetoxidans]|jgi:hypothetical protein
MWKVVYIAPNRPIAEMLQGLLRDGGILTMLRPIGAPHLGDSAGIEILVPESEVEEANEIIAASFG